MNTFQKIFTFSFFLVIASLLSACAGGTGLATSWPGLTISKDSQVAYLSHNNHVYAVNLSNGSETWRYPQKTENKVIFYAPVALTDDNQLIAGSYDHKLYSLNPETGAANQSAWPFIGATDKFVTAPLADKESIFAPSSDNFLYAVDLQGNSLWSFEATHALWATPVFDENGLYVASMDHHLYALNPSTGDMLWKTEDLGGALVSAPAIDDKGVLFVGTFKSQLLALDTTARGKFVWEPFQTDGWIWASPLLKDGMLYISNLEGQVFAIDSATGKPVWDAPFHPDTGEKRMIVGTPLIVGDTLYVASKAGILYAVDPDTGKARWNKTIGGEIYASLVSIGDTILVAPNQSDAILIALDLDGNRKWSFTPVK